jgi:hypothetical protein
VSTLGIGLSRETEDALGNGLLLDVVGAAADAHPRAREEFVSKRERVDRGIGGAEGRRRADRQQVIRRAPDVLRLRELEH